MEVFFRDEFSWDLIVILIDESKVINIDILFVKGIFIDSELVIKVEYVLIKENFEFISGDDNILEGGINIYLNKNEVDFDFVDCDKLWKVFIEVKKKNVLFEEVVIYYCLLMDVL